MTRTFTAAAGAALVVIAGCAPVLDTNNSQWTVTMSEPEATPNAQNPVLFDMEWCPAIFFNKLSDGATGTPIPTTTTQAPNNVNIQVLEVVDDDVYQINPFFFPEEFGQPITFDIGPIGTFYEEQPTTYQVIGAQSGDVTPASMNVTRRIADGRADGESEFTISLDYTFDCGGAESVTRGDVSCACETNKRVTLDVLATGVTF